MYSFTACYIKLNHIWICRLSWIAPFLHCKITKRNSWRKHALETVAKTCVNQLAICFPCLGNLQHRNRHLFLGLIFSMQVLEMVLLNVPILEMFEVYFSSCLSPPCYTDWYIKLNHIWIYVLCFWWRYFLNPKSENQTAAQNMPWKSVAKACVNEVAICFPCLGNLQHRMVGNKSITAAMPVLTLICNSCENVGKTKWLPC